MLGCDTILRGSTRRPAASTSAKLEGDPGDRPRPTHRERAQRLG
jgi:hypothetical protein